MSESLFLLQTFLGIVSITALALAAMVTERTQKEAAISEARNELENRVAERTAELRALSTRLESVREDERQHIAREIHDELGQILTALKIDLFWVQKRANGDLNAKISSMVELTELMIRTVRRIATELRPSLLDHLGLIGTLEWQAEDFESRTGVVCNLDMAIDTCPLDARRSTEVFRMVQEALTNVARHADASQVDFRVQATASALVVEVSDDGQGFSPRIAEQGRTLGLIGMRERAARCGGQIEFSSGPGRGTTVRIEIPLYGGELEERA